MRLPAAALALSFLTVVACGGGEEPLGPDAQPPEGELLVGGAEHDGTGFVELVDGADAELIPGAQGGFHVWINVRVHGVDGRLFLEREARRTSDDALVLAGSRQLFEVPTDAMSDWWNSDTAAPSFMCPAPVGLQIFDTELTFHAVLYDEDDRVVAEDSLVLVPRCPEGDQAEFCASICSG